MNNFLSVVEILNEWSDDSGESEDDVDEPLPNNNNGYMTDAGYETGDTLPINPIDFDDDIELI